MKLFFLKRQTNRAELGTSYYKPSALDKIRHYAKQNEISKLDVTIELLTDQFIKDGGITSRQDLFESERLKVSLADYILMNLKHSFPNLTRDDILRHIDTDMLPF